MNFRIKSIDQEICEKFFAMTDKELKAHNAKKIIVQEPYSAPCRLSLRDCNPGEEVIAFNYSHHNVSSPYSGCGPVFVKLNSKKTLLPDNILPDIVLDNRRFSVRSYDEFSMMTRAEVVLGKELKSYIEETFNDEKNNYAQVHFAAPGCWIFDFIRT